MSGVSRTKAVRTMRIAQIAGLGMVALAAGAVMFSPGLPEPKADWADPQGPDIVGQPDGGGSKKPISRPGIDTGSAGDALDQIANIEKPAETDTTTTIEMDKPPETAVPEARGWAYLGGVFEPKVSFALVNINGKQRMLRQGQELPELDAKVVSIEPGRIEIEREGRRERIERSKATGTLVSVSSGTETGAVAGSTIIAPGDNQMRTLRAVQREELENNPDLDKRRAEFLRRQQERQGIER